MKSINSYYKFKKVLINPTEEYYKNYKKNLSSVDLEKNDSINQIGNENKGFSGEELELKTTGSLYSDVTAF
jgi:hypothetical protein